MTRRAFSLVELLVVIGVLAILFGLTSAAVQQVRAAAAQVQCQNNIRQLGTALHQYQAELKVLPPGVSHRNGRDPMPFLGWHARVLPYIEQESLWKQTQEAFAKTRRFTSSPPHPCSTVIPIFGCTSDYRTASPSNFFPGQPAFTSYLGVAGTDQFQLDGLFFLDSRVRFEQITDGLSNTLMIGERPPSADERLGWWYAGVGQKSNGSADMILGAAERNFGTWSAVCPPGAYSFGPGDFSNQCDAFHFWSPHRGGANFCFADGSVRFLSYSAAPLMPALATRAGGEKVVRPE